MGLGAAWFSPVLEGGLWCVRIRCPAVPSSLFCSWNRCFQSVLVHIQLLWELVLLGEPLVVVAPSPTMSSEVVLALARYQARTQSPACSLQSCRWPIGRP